MMLANAAPFASTLIRILPNLARLIICSRGAVCQGAAVATANLSIWTEFAGVRNNKTTLTSGAPSASAVNHMFPRFATAHWNINAVIFVCASWATPRSIRTKFAVCPVGTHMMLASGALFAAATICILIQFARIRPLRIKKSRV
jgi:hypothetical protein